MILSDREIKAALKSKFVVILPEPPEERWTSTAIDLTLDPVVLQWKQPTAPPSGGDNRIYPNREGFNILDMLKNTQYTDRVEIKPLEGFTLEPKAFVLAYTAERIWLPIDSRIAARVEGKSSLARLGVGVHVTAPTIHAGFGFNPSKPDDPGLPIQLEIFNLGNQRVVLDARMPICQLILEEVREVPNKGYTKRFSTQSRFSADPESKPTE
jgi:dCTP deaminase